MLSRKMAVGTSPPAAVPVAPATVTVPAAAFQMKETAGNPQSRAPVGSVTRYLEYPVTLREETLRILRQLVGGHPLGTVREGKAGILRPPRLQERHLAQHAKVNTLIFARVRTAWRAKTPRTTQRRG